MSTGVIGLMSLILIKQSILLRISSGLLLLNIFPTEKLLVSTGSHLGLRTKLTLFSMGYFKSTPVGRGHYSPLLTSLFLAQSQSNLVYLQNLTSFLQNSQKCFENDVTADL